MNDVLFVMLGGALGSGLRFGVGTLLPASEGSFPWATISVNVIGTLVLGLVMGVSLSTEAFPRPLMLLLGTGLCGGFTTYSAFAVESVVLAQHGQFSTAAIYIVSTLVACSIAALIGFVASRLMVH